MPEHDAPADDSSTEAPADPTDSTGFTAVDDPAAFFERDDVTTDVVEIETDAEHFERYQDWEGMAIAGITNDDGDVLLVKNTDPEVCHDWVLPHGAVQDEDADWAETAADWVDGLTGISVTIDDVVHVRRNDITLDIDDEDGEKTRETTAYHVVFSGHPHDGEEIQDDVEYDCDDVWTAGWHDAVPESARETESGDIARFVD